MAKIHGGRLIARALRAEGVDTLFTLTGGHIVPILDGCVEEGIRIVDVRHEETAGHAAEAYTRLTGRLGVAAVTAAPGVTNLATAVMNAHLSCTPMLVLGGRHLIRQEHAGGLQELDHPPIFASITKLATTAWETARLADYIAIAARHAFSGRGGPVFLDVPLDVQSGLVDENTPLPTGYRATEPAGADPDTVDRIADLLAGADRPVIFAGGGLRGGGAEALAAVAEMFDAPVFANSGGRGALSPDHPLLGSLARSQALARADVVLALQVDWDFRTGYGRKIPAEATVVQVDPEPTKLGWNRPAPVAVVANPGRVLAQLAKAGRSRPGGGWSDEIRAAEAAARTEAETEAESDAVPIAPQRFARDVAGFFGQDSIVAVDGGDIVATTARWLRVSTPGHLLEPGPAGTLGTGPGFALAAKVVHPERTVGIVFGDGGFGFNGFEYDTFVRHGLPVIGVLGNDGVWSNIKTFHRSFYPDRVVASDLGRRPYHAVVDRTRRLRRAGHRACRDRPGAGEGEGQRSAGTGRRPHRRDVPRLDPTTPADPCRATVVDLRSDTVTKPTAAMRRAIAEAEVGDDVFHDDPSVLALERRVADLLGKDDAMYVPSGTMSNQAALRVHTQPGDVVLAPVDAHVHIHEMGAPYVLSGVTIQFLDGERGTFGPADVSAAIPQPSPSLPASLFQPVTLLWVENTHNAAGGAVWPPELLSSVTAEAKRLRIATHMDGAQTVECRRRHRTVRSRAGRRVRHGERVLLQGPGSADGVGSGGTAGPDRPGPVLQADVRGRVPPGGDDGGGGPPRRGPSSAAARRRPRQRRPGSPPGWPRSPASWWTPPPWKPTWSTSTWR